MARLGCLSFSISLDGHIAHVAQHWPGLGLRGLSNLCKEALPMWGQFMPQSNDLQSLHGTANDALVRLLFSRVSTMRSGASYIGEATEKSAGNAPVSTDAPGLAGQGGDIGGSESGGVKG